MKFENIILNMKSILHKGKVECGVDESGRGSVIGRLYCGACIWDENITEPHIPHTSIKDSKKYSSKNKREEAYEYVINNSIAYGSAYATADEINEIGLANAWINTMHKAILNTYICADVILVDGNYFQPLEYRENYNNYTYETIVKGDDMYYSIASASIIAKV